MQKKPLVFALSVAFVSAAAFAQERAPTERIEITGSSIKRVQDEGALPLQVITRQEIERRGFINAEQLLMSISANGTGADNLSSNVGIQLGTTDRNNNGNSSANLRGLGASSTLVLLNGRRMVNHGAKGNAVDLNSIPLAAIERVEILKDGASAIYGTDAIGGVINFILRKDYRGVEITAFMDLTEQGGGNIYRGSLLAGWGDLARDKWNASVVLSYDKQEILGAHSRSFANGYQPDRGLAPDTTGTQFATQTGLAGTALGATFRTPSTGTQTFNRANLLAFQGRCDSFPNQNVYRTDVIGNPGFRFGCAYDYGGAEVLLQPVERTQVVGRAAWQFAPNHQLVFEATASRVDATKYFEEYQITTTGSFTGMQYPVNGPYYQDLSAFIPTFNRNLPIAYRWRCVDCGQRTINTVTDNYRFLVGLEGTFSLWKAWDYRLGVSTSKSKAESNLQHGFMYTAPLTTALGSGQVNPWLLPGQTQSAAGQQLLDAARADGANLFAGETMMTTFDGTMSADVWKLPAGPVSVAMGFDTRRESYRFDDGSRAGAIAIFQAPFDALFPKVSRTVKAVYGEALVPIVKNLEITGAVRYDDYSDFGGTTNPKISLRWHPVDPLLVRASYNEGFRAPSFFQLYGATGEAPVPANIADPVLCPGGNVAGADLSVCSIRPNGRSGGNRNLQPETSKQWQAGFVVNPVKWFTASADYWEIKRFDHIYELTPQQVIANFQTFPENLVRGTNGRLDGPGGYIQAGFVNASGDITKGWDLSLDANWRLIGARWIARLDGTYIQSFKSRIFDTQPFTEFAGQWSDRDLYPHWKHTASVTYERGPWGLTLYQQYTSRYKDMYTGLEASGLTPPPPGWDPYVHPYIVYHLSATYTGIKHWTIQAGVKNILDTDPPFSAHNLDFTPGAGWDPRVGDPRGRAYTLRVSYKF
jgi:iron complex outermembrane receptor protein